MAGRYATEDRPYREYEGYEEGERDRDGRMSREEAGRRGAEARWGRSREGGGEDWRGADGRGFERMDPERRREIAREGGLASSRRPRDEYGRFEAGEDEDYEEERDRGGRMTREEAGRRGAEARWGRSREDYDDDRRGDGRGFASMDPERRREIAREGGRASSRRPRDEYGRFETEEEEYEEDEGGRGGRMSREEAGRRGAEARWGRSRDEDEDERGGSDGRGFAAMDPERRREIAREGGRVSHESGRAHEFSSENAREAGRAAHRRGRAHEFSPEEAREAGRKGGMARARNGGNGRRASGRG